MDTYPSSRVAFGRLCILNALGVRTDCWIPRSQVCSSVEAQGSLGSPGRLWLSPQVHLLVGKYTPSGSCAMHCCDAAGGWLSLTRTHWCCLHCCCSPFHFTALKSPNWCKSKSGHFSLLQAEELPLFSVSYFLKLCFPATGSIQLG